MKNKAVLPIAVILHSLLALGGLGAQTVVVSPQGSFPLGETPFEFGVGGGLAVRVPLLGGDLSPRLGWNGLFLKSGAGRVDVVTLGTDYVFPLVATKEISRGPLVGVGGYGAFFPGVSPLFNPAVSLGIRFDAALEGLLIGFEPRIDGFLAQRNGAPSSLWTGAGVSLRVGVNLGTAQTARPRMKILDPRFEPFLPSFYKYYASRGLGTVDLVNEETSPVEDVKIQVFAPRYMDGPQAIATLPTLKAGEKVTVPLSALFRNEVLGVTETDAAQFQVLVSYRKGEVGMTVNRESTLRIEGRNSITWDDDRRAAAFVTTKDPTILKLGRNAVASVPVDRPGPGNEGLRKAAALVSALGEFGLRYVVDPNSSYQTLSAGSASLDYVQFPVQTLDYRSGDCDDLSVLYAALLEAVGLESAFITVPGHIFAAFELGMTEPEAKSMFSSQNELIYLGGKVWVPVETTLMNKGFLVAWAEGARQWRQASTQGTAKLIPVREAWRLYEPSFIDSTERSEVTARFPSGDLILARYDGEVTRLTDRELKPLVADLSARIKSRATPGLYNRLGTTYARYGVLEKAESAFKEAAKANYPQALYNLGNIQYLKKDLKGALAEYERAFKANPDSVQSALAVARVAYELGDTKKATSTYRAAQVLDPAKASTLAYVVGGPVEGTTANRASDAASRSAVDWDE